MNRVVEPTQIAIHGIGLGFILANLMIETQTVVVHHHKRLNNFGQNICRNQLAFEAYLTHREVVKTVDYKRI